MLSRNLIIVYSGLVTYRDGQLFDNRNFILGQQ